MVNCCPDIQMHDAASSPFIYVRVLEKMPKCTKR
jgi:hypothetical protein